MSNQNNKTLGKGLSSLISGKASDQPVSGSLNTPYFPKKTGSQSGQVVYLDIDQIKINPHQPRKEFNQVAMDELISSVKTHGIIQPLVVTSTLGGGWELIAGERRLRAAREAHLNQVPVIIRTAKELEKIELSLIENIQRHDLNPIEKAESFKKLVDDFSLTHEEASKRLSISRSQFSNFIRLLSLPPEIQKGVASGKISLSQAKLMLEVKNQKQQQQIYHKAVQTGQTVVDTKREIGKFKNKKQSSQNNLEPQIKDWQDELSASLNTKVRIKQKTRGGLIEIEFYSEEELKNIIKKIK